VRFFDHAVRSFIWSIPVFLCSKEMGNIDVDVPNIDYRCFENIDGNIDVSPPLLFWSSIAAVVSARSVSLLFRCYPSVSFSGVCFRLSVCSVFAFFSVPRVARTRSNNKIKSQGASCSVFGVDVDAAQTQQRQSNGKCRQACASCARLQVFVFVSPCYCANHQISTNKQTVNKLKDILINNYRIYKPSLKANTIHNY